MHWIVNTLRLRMKYAWQRMTRGYGDDEIDWELRAKIETEVKQEMEEKLGPQLAAMREHKKRVMACESIVSDEGLSRDLKITKIEEQFPGDDEEAIAQRAHYFSRLER